MNKNVQTFMGCETEYREADTVLFGVPFDGTASFRPGARFGPGAIRGESCGLEGYSPHSDRDLADCRVFDGGDLELPFGNPRRVLELTRDYTARVLRDGKLPVMLGGEHLITLGAVEAALERYPDLHVVHLDAHADLRDEYLGEALSHATVMRRVWELVGDGRIHQFGIRSGLREEFAFAAAHTDLHKFDLAAFPALPPRLEGVPVYFSLDLDVLDPSALCGTGTPEPGGVSFRELLEAILQLHRLRVVGCDVNELSPPYDPSGASTAAACKAVRELLLQLQGGLKNG